MVYSPELAHTVACGLSAVYVSLHHATTSKPIAAFSSVSVRAYPVETGVVQRVAVH
eukprot:SAG11_NODE_29046_length_315_cov_0.708333_1_plen_55_part_10